MTKIIKTIMNAPPKSTTCFSCGPLPALPTEFQILIDSARVNQNRGVLRSKATAHKSGVAISTLWRDVKLGVFAQPIRISTRTVAWVEVEVDAILAAKALMTRTAQKIDLAHFVALLTAPTGTAQPDSVREPGPYVSSSMSTMPNSFASPKPWRVYEPT